MNLLEHLTAAQRSAFLARRHLALPRRAQPVRPFLPAGPGPIRFIAEFKRSSPSHGAFPAQPLQAVARRYAAAGAAALSVLVAEEGFSGSIEDLRLARDATHLPLLCKGFVSDRGQIAEAYAYGADAVLLIARVLGPELGAFLQAVQATGMAALVEVHSAAELEAALAAGAGLIGVNNRDLATLACDTGLFLSLAPLAPPGVRLVAESGYRSLADVRSAEMAGARAVLVGEALLERGGALLGDLAMACGHVG